jgi:hypothetical protein
MSKVTEVRLPVPGGTVRPLDKSAKTRYDKGMKDEKRTMTALQDTVVYQAVEHALANFLGTDDLDETVVELVADRVRIQVEKMAEDPTWVGYFDDVLAGTSTYVQTDLDEVELNDYLCELVTQLEAYGVV